MIMLVALAAIGGCGGLVADVGHRRSDQKDHGLGEVPGLCNSEEDHRAKKAAAKKGRAMNLFRVW